MLLKGTGATMVCACVGALGTSGCASKAMSSTPSLPSGSYRAQDGRLCVDLAKVGDLLSIGGSAKCTVEEVDGSERKVIIVRSDEADYRAFANACTHNGKELDYLHGDGWLACCGRSSRFDLRGQVVQGPAEDALPTYPVSEESGELVIEM
jgi:nitrite reductase/ring-hydroxylating ferredoxin subunit